MSWCCYGVLSKSVLTRTEKLIKEGRTLLDVTKKSKAAQLVHTLVCVGGGQGLTAIGAHSVMVLGMGWGGPGSLDLSFGDFLGFRERCSRRASWCCLCEFPSSHAASISKCLTGFLGDTDELSTSNPIACVELRLGESKYLATDH